MTTALWCLLGFAGWTLALVVVGIGMPRVAKVLAGQAKANDFKADEPHGSERYRRTMRAHMNCVENLPIFASVVLVGTVAGVRAPDFGMLAVVLLAARVVQSSIHISSGSVAAVNARFMFFLVQLVCMAAMVVEIARYA